MKKNILQFRFLQILLLWFSVGIGTQVGAQSTIVGGVYAMSNGEGQIEGNVQGPNSIIAYGQDINGNLTIIDSYPTGGNGGDFDGGEGLDPLISAYAITKSNDNRFVLAVNAGSNTITVMGVNDDFSLEVIDTEATLDIGPNSISYVPARQPGVNGIVYVSNISREEFVDLGEPSQQGSIIGYKLMNDGDLIPIENSRRELANRPSAVQISPDGDFLVVASINSGSSALASGNEDEIVVYGLDADGNLTDTQLSGATSTLRDNAEGRNLPSAIGFKIVGKNIVVVTEAREFRPDGTPPVFPGLQDGSVSTWQIENDGSLTAINLDVATGENNTGRTACWLDFSDDNTFFVSNAIEAGLASFSFDNGQIELLNQVAAQGTGATGNTTDPGSAFGTTEGWIDLSISDDGAYLYQAYGLTGTVGVYAINGAELTLIQEVEGDLPVNNIQGIISVGQKPSADELTATYRLVFDAAWSQASHPQDFPFAFPNVARWSPVAGLTHDSSVSLFTEGEVATDGIVNISQTGSRDPLDSELAAVIASGSGETYIESATRVRPSPGTIATEFEVSSSHPLLSLASMIAPSPDWMVSLRDYNLMQNGEFIESAVIGFVPYDTGSDDGDTFRADNNNTSPREGIYEIVPGLGNILEENGQVSRLGMWRLERIDAGSNCDLDGGTIVGGPYQFNVDGEADNIPEDGITLSGNTGANSQWIVVGETGTILGLPPTFSAPDFDAAGPGICYVYHLSHEDGLTGLEVGANIDDIAGCFSLSNEIYVNRIGKAAGDFVGGVFAMTNGEGQIAGNVQGPNSIVSFGQAADGSLSMIGSFPTGGNGGDFDGGEGLDPLISAYAITKSIDNQFVLAVNAGSNTVTSMKVSNEFTLEIADTQSTQDVGPNSIAYTPSNLPGVNGLVYVSNITREEFLALGEPGQQGSLVGFWLLDDGTLMPIEGSRRELANRPSSVQFSPAGDYVVATSINSGAAGLASGSEDEIVLYSVSGDGTLSADQLDGATSTLRGNTENRNLPSAIGTQIVGDNYVVVTEAREFQADGTPPAFPALQDGSVSTWQIVDGAFVAIDLDVASGENNTGRTACWLDFSDDNTFFVSNAIEAGLASYSFDNGDIELINQVAAQGTGATGNTTDPGAAFGTTEGWIDLWISDDGKYLYQAYGLTGEIGVFAIDGAALTQVQEIGGLPTTNIQGIVSVGQPIGPGPNNPVVGAVYAMSNGEGQIAGNVQGPNSIVAYGQAENGTLSVLGSYPTGGNGGDFDGGEGLDPLISAYAITKTNDNRFVLAVNAGSNTVTSMKVNEDFTLEVVDTEATIDIGPNSVAYVPSRKLGVNGVVYVSNITREEFLAQGEPAQQGSIVGYYLLENGDLVPIENSRRELPNRPSAVQISPDGDFLVVASINAGSSALASDDQNEIAVYGLNFDGILSDAILSGATSTLRDNAEGRNLPSAIGFQIVQNNYVVVTEAREFRPDGTPPVFPGLQDGSVSTWQIGTDGSLTAINLDVASGENNTGRTACWLDFSDDNTFFVSNAIEAGLASYSFNNGEIELINQVAAQGTGATGNTTDPGAAFGTTEGWIDLWISDDGKYLYQAYGLTGEVGVFEIDGNDLTLLQEIGGLPSNNIQGIVSVGQQRTTDSEVTAEYRIIFDALWSEPTHPVDFPGTEPNVARWSPVAGLTHDDSYVLFEEGDIASEGLVNISQTGSRDPLDSELADVILGGSGEFYIESNTRVRPSPDTISTTFQISASHPYVSLSSMIAPSPDWMVSLRGLNLMENGEFVDRRIVQFSPYDTGSDSGETFTSDNQDTQPREAISAITEGVLANNGEIASLGLWRFERIDTESNCNINGGTLVGGPFLFCIDGNDDFISGGALNLSNATGTENVWVITDVFGVIIAMTDDILDMEFEALGEGVSHIYNLSFDTDVVGAELGNNIEDLRGCYGLSLSTFVERTTCDNITVGAVYAMSNGESQVGGNVQGPNSIVAYGQADDGTLSRIGTFPTGGNGGDFDGGEGLDPLISAYAITKSLDNKFVLAVNAGSNTVTAMTVNQDFTLEVSDTQSTQDVGPNSIAYTPSSLDGVNGLVYVSNITREEFLALGEPGQQGSIVGFWLLDDGTLTPIEGSRRELANRPSSVQFSPNGDYVVATSINSGAAGLASGSEDEIVLYSVNADGTLSTDQLDGATSTLRGNTEGRNLPSAIGTQIVGDNYVVVTEAREFQSDGTPPAFPALQDGSVSTWQIVDGAFVAVDLDVASGENNTGRTACWLDFSDENTFFVSNAIEAGLASYSFDNGEIELINQVAAQGIGATGNTTDPGAAFGTTQGWIDLWISDDGSYLYQAYGLTGEIGVFAIDGSELTLLQEVGGDLPVNNIQGIVSVGERETTSTIDPNSNVTDVSVYPNPNNGTKLAIDFELNSNEDYQVSILDVNGKQISGINAKNGTGQAGMNTVSFERLTLSSGLYLVKIDTNTATITRKVIVVK